MCVKILGEHATTKHGGARVKMGVRLDSPSDGRPVCKVSTAIGKEIRRRSFLKAVLSIAAPPLLVGGPTAEDARPINQRKDAAMPRIIVFDVIETMLDIRALGPHFKRAFGEARVLDEWFSQVLLYSQVATVAGPYFDFGTIGGAALDMTAAGRG